MTATLPQHIDTALGAWIPRQRWFAGQGRAVLGTTLVSAVPLTGPQDTEPAGFLALVHVCFADGQAETYHVPLGLRTRLPAALEPYLIARLEDTAVYDATGDPELTSRLVELITRNHHTPRARFRTQGGHPLAAPTGTERTRPLGVEQSNTSIVIDDRYLLKLFRRVVAGPHPELEALAALQQAGNRDVPRLLGSVSGRQGTDELTYGLLQHYEPDADSGWDLALRSILLGDAPSSEGRTGGFPGAAQLGATVAGVHRDLAAQLPVAVLDQAGLERLALQLRKRYVRACSSAPQLRRYAPSVHSVFAAVATLPAPLPVQRVHGDLHLGQVLRGPRGWLVLDFEGEPAASRAERTALTSPVKDLAGMLRSFDYAARHARRCPSAPSPDDVRAWAETSRKAFLAGYAAVTALDPGLQPLLRAYELDKAVYEVVYETRHRPALVDIPLSAVERMTAASC
ncbi:maltokinase N-terminal cap-like domain-containing protein [Streptomyces rimosus]|uniref:maltokinase N-terminal cap-like domain-containing protein n=1 Tax=Streptomyces rimosus TaxID=1927 RepID=UPI0037D414DE